MMWVCLDCTAARSVGAPVCPHCGSERRADQGSAEELGIQATYPDGIQEEDDMGKITRHGGPSVEGADVDPGSGTVTPLAEVDEQAKPEETQEETPAEEQQSQDSDAQSDEQNEQRRPRRGRKTTE